MTFAQRRNRRTTPFSECIPIVKRRISVLVPYWFNTEDAVHDMLVKWFCSLKEYAIDQISLLLRIEM